MTVFAAHVRVVCLLVAVAIFDPGEGFFQRSCTEVQAEVLFGAELFTPLHELVGAELVRLDAVPGKFWTGWTLFSGTYAILPVVCGTKISSWV